MTDKIFTYIVPTLIVGVNISFSSIKHENISFLGAKNPFCGRASPADTGRLSSYPQIFQVIIKLGMYGLKVCQTMTENRFQFFIFAFGKKTEKGIF